LPRAGIKNPAWIRFASKVCHNPATNEERRPLPIAVSAYIIGRDEWKVNKGIAIGMARSEIFHHDGFAIKPERLSVLKVIVGRPPTGQG